MAKSRSPDRRNLRPRAGRAAARLCTGTRALLVAGLIGLCGASRAAAAGASMFTTVPFSTGEKPQSKLWYHDGSYWGVLRGPDGVAIYEKTGDAWRRATNPGAVLATSGQADVKWDGNSLCVLVYATVSRLFEFSYDASLRIWNPKAGFPVTLPNPAGSETMVLEEDSTGRLWTAVEGDTHINVYYSTSADHRTWSATPVVLQTGVSPDDICSIVAFGGDKVGVFWSDQMRDEFGFRIHHDGTAPTAWDAEEVADSGPGHADDHVHLAADSQGRVYAITKNVLDQMAVHRRGPAGGWTTQANVLPGTGTRGILMLSEADSKVYILFTRWGVVPNRIEYRTAGIDDLVFGGTTAFITSTNDMNNVTGMKQTLPPGSLCAVAEDGGHCFCNSFGSPPPGVVTPPGPPQPPAPPGQPTALTAAVAGTNPQTVQLAWNAPAGGDPAAGYDVDRIVAGGTWTRLNPAPISTTQFIDTAVVPGWLCYQVSAVSAAALVGAPSAPVCAFIGAPPPDAPRNVTTALNDSHNRLMVRWEPAPGGTAATSFNVYRHIDGGPATRLNPLPLALQPVPAVNFWIDSTLATGNVCYEVTGLDAASHEGSASIPACAALLPAPPGAPQSASAEVLAGPPLAVHLTWESPASGPPASYRVYRRLNGGTSVRLDTNGIGVQSFLDGAPPLGSLCYYVSAVDAYGQEGATSAPLGAIVPPSVPSDGADATPPAHLAIRAGPNPFNPSLHVEFSLPHACAFDVAVYDVRGGRVATLAHGRRAAGPMALTWNGRTDAGAIAGSGTYLVVLRAGPDRLQRKVTLVK